MDEHSIIRRMNKVTKQAGWMLGLASAVAVGLFLIGMVRNQTLDYWYLPYNLFLAFIPLLLALWLRRVAGKGKGYNWRVLLLTFLWLLFLPNTFYIVTDFIHLPETQRVDIVQDVVMLMQFSVLGVALGLYSLFLVHTAYARFVPRIFAAWGAGLVLFLCSFAIYLGRELRWNSWDAALHPVSVFTDSLEIITRGDAWFMVLSFFAMTGSLYLLFWCSAKLAR